MKIAIVVALCLVALALIGFLSFYTVKIKHHDDVSKATIALIRTVVACIIAMCLGSSAALLMTGCAAKRSITVQGTIYRMSPDSARVIISSQESYTGTKR